MDFGDFAAMLAGSTALDSKSIPKELLQRLYDSVDGPNLTPEQFRSIRTSFIEGVSLGYSVGLTHITNQEYERGKKAGAEEMYEQMQRRLEITTSIH